MSLKRLSIFSFLTVKMFFFSLFFSGSIEPDCHSFQSSMVLLPSFSTGVALDKTTLVFVGKTLMEKSKKVN